MPTRDGVAQVLDTLGSGELKAARVLRLSDAEGAFGGWVSGRQEAEMFRRLEQYFLLGGDWCCTSRHDNDGRLYPLDPPPLRHP